MKITKQRLKEIIREELAAEGSREDMMMSAGDTGEEEADGLTLLSNVLGKVTPLRDMHREILLDPLDVDDLQEALKYFKAAQPLSQE